MERFLAGLADLTRRRRWFVVAVWAALLLGGAWFAAHQFDRLSSGGWEVPGSQSATAATLLERFPGRDGVQLAVLVEGSSGGRTDAALERSRAALSKFADVRVVGNAQGFENGTAAVLPLVYVGDEDDATARGAALREALVSDANGTSVRVIGEPALWSELDDVSKDQLATAEAIGLPLALVILLAAFGTLVAAIAPLAVGFLAVAVTGALVYWLAGLVPMSIFAPNMASMIGIGVAIDYSLFVVSRFRRELHAGQETGEALRTALASAGTAVVFSGGTVVVSLAGLFLVDVNAIRSMAAGAIIVVAVAVLTAITLLPALLAIAGRRVERFKVPFTRTSAAEGGRFWPAWTRRVMRRPGLALAAGVAVLATVAVPAFSLQTESHGLAQLPAGSEVRQATERAAELTGFTGPIQIFTDDRQAAAEIAAAVARLPGIRSASGIASTDGSHYLVEAVLAADPESREAQAVYRRTADTAVAIASRHGTDAVVGGMTASAVDVNAAVTGSLWKIVVFVLAVSYLILLVLLRSVLLPLKAVFMNALSVGAAYGVLVAVFQWGWLDWTGYSAPGYLDPFVPAVVLAVTFGLSMDYEVFLLTRIRERYLAGASNEQAVAEGLAGSARTITAAALIMVAVFGAFALAGAPSIKALGVGLSVAIFVDATIVRLVLVPATMRLLGDWNWWLPRPLAHILHTSEAGPASTRRTGPAIGAAQPFLLQRGTAEANRARASSQSIRCTRARAERPGSRTG
jgi:RND superfamily putative drug exporter